jgi:lysophospholipase L1-like esterase
MDSPEVINAIKAARSDMIFTHGLANRGNVVAANRTKFVNNGVSSGSSITVTYRTVHFTRGSGRVTFPRFVFVNSALSATGEISGTHPFTVKAAIEYGGVSYPIYFNGSRTKLLAIDEQVISDPVMLSIPANTQFAVRTNCLAATLGDKWPTGYSLTTAIGESYTGSDVTDSVASMGAFAATGYGPAAILGSVAGEAPTVLITGSSSGDGQGDTAEAPYYDLGYLSRACRTSGMDYVRLTRPSATMLHFLTTNKRQLEFVHKVKPTHVIQQLGSNDISNGADLATLKSRAQEIWDIMASTGAKVYQATATPVATSSDSFATLVNQTLNANNSVRVAFNDWIRSKPSGISGYIECCDVVESALNSGKWRVDGTANAYTVDGTHLTQRGHRETAASMDLLAAIKKC